MDAALRPQGFCVFVVSVNTKCTVTIRQQKSTIIKEGDTYYRFTKNEKHKAITMEESERLMSGWKEVDDFSLAHLTGYEGPTCFMIEPAKGGKPAKWCLLLDQYSKGAGYQSFETDDLSEGDFEAGDRMDFPFHPVRHGTVLALTDKESQRLKAADKHNKFTVGD